MSNVINIFSKKTVKHKPAFKSDEQAAEAVGATEELTLHEIFNCSKADLLIATAEDDCLQVKENDLVVINAKLKPKPNSLIFYSIRDDQDICLYSDLPNRNDILIYGVVTHFIRSLGAV